MTTTPSRPVMELSAPDGWPAPPDPAAYHGLAGAIVERLAPNTEADPVAILTQLLVACGAMLGHSSFFQVDATRHHPNAGATPENAWRWCRTSDRRWPPCRAKVHLWRR